MDADIPEGTNLSFHLSGMITDHRRNLGCIRKIEMLLILQICPRSSQTIGDIYNFKFSLVGKIWDDQETVKSQTIWDFPTYENQALITHKVLNLLLYNVSSGMFHCSFVTNKVLPCYFNMALGLGSTSLY